MRLLVKHHFDLVAAAAEVKLPVALMEKVKKTTAMDLAIQNWLDCGRLPPPCSERKVKPYGWKRTRTG